MTAQPHRRAMCRLCGGADLVPALSLPPTPPANAFVKAEARDRPQDSYPLDLALCGGCGHLQLLDVLSPFDLFQRGRSAIGARPEQVAHAESFAADILAAYHPPPESFVLGIGSNDGTMLKVFEDAGYRVHGVEPAVDLARESVAAGIPTFPGFFGAGVATRLEEENGPAAIVVVPSVLAHVDDAHAFTEGLCLLLARSGVLAFEVPYLADLVEQGLIDAIRHENLGYHAVVPLVGFFHSCDLELFAARTVGGGRLRGYVQHLGGPHAGDGSVDVLRAREERLGLDRIETYRRLGDEISDLADRVGDLLAGFKAEGRRIAGFGAPARATTLMHACGLDSDTLDFVVDEAPWKQGLYTPGAHVPVLAPEAIAELRPDCIVVLAWDAADEIIARHAAFRDGGGRFLVPLPTPRIV